MTMPSPPAVCQGKNHRGRPKGQLFFNRCLGGDPASVQRDIVAACLPGLEGYTRLGVGAVR